ncbi:MULTISPECIES: hypothetical protein [Lactiplantibacillus]|uniref:Uncharacterized protein n=1 Tax=Lactiplantibacillus pentosus TaxID=1589 RepID=A0AAW8WFZ4_LACPE|nr:MULTISPECIES: hypothetical protein [Lactiplantibacillus]MBU7461137.1 hypothetical protein [Lactiplantibacillus pentosus]MBU7476503.1 hypothetical protein [Lactiplantibacillus pentosus]MBU7483716.1 hypothetical protein [Lactiplantibacillus sp. 30.2.29]MBU7487333.1 hypothetical protein [Lactiplantibacillus pentosus]MBU7499969.1 hypothetical protein [Lactiplantibacillus pentosus]
MHKRLGWLLFAMLIGMCAVFSLNVKADSTTRDITIQNLNLKVYDNDSSTAVSMPDSEYYISYTDDDTTKIVLSGLTDANGAIVDKVLKDIPNNVTKLKIYYTLGNSNRGYVRHSDGRKYQFVFTKSIPASDLINYMANTRFGNSSDSESFISNYVASRINNYYVQSIDFVNQALSAAQTYQPDIDDFQSKPIDIYYQRNFYLNQGNAYYNNGHDGSGIPDIVIGDRTEESHFTDAYLMHNVMHEWTHWNMRQTAQLGGGSYTTHYTYNTNFKTSYKEGVALFAGEMFAKNYDLSTFDNEIQTDDSNGINRLYGKSTNRTVQLVLYDLLDETSTGEDENYNISSSILQGQSVTTAQRNQINFGLLYAEMMQSKAKTLSEFLQYIQEKYVTSDTDKANFQQVLTINGLSSTGDFTLDADGNPLSD